METDHGKYWQVVDMLPQKEIYSADILMFLLIICIWQIIQKWWTNLHCWVTNLKLVICFWLHKQLSDGILMKKTSQYVPACLQ